MSTFTKCFARDKRNKHFLFMVSLLVFTQHVVCHLPKILVCLFCKQQGTEAKMFLC